MLEVRWDRQGAAGSAADLHRRTRLPDAQEVRRLRGKGLELGLGRPKAGVLSSAFRVPGDALPAEAGGVTGSPARCWSSAYCVLGAALPAEAGGVTS